MGEKFAEISVNIQKAESYLYTDSAACMTYISRALEGIVKSVCEAKNIPLKSDGQERKLAELIDELGLRKIAGNKILHTLHNLRIHRNRNAHNEIVSLADNMKLIEQAHTIYEWCMKISGQKKHVPSQNERSNDASYVKISVNALMNEYARNPSEASRKYDGKLITILGGNVQSVRKTEDSDDVILTLLSEYEATQSGASIAYKVECFYPARHEGRVRQLKKGQKFAATGIWRGGKLTGCVWSSDKVSVHPQSPRRNSTKQTGHNKTPFLLRAVIVAVIIIIIIILSRN